MSYDTKDSGSKLATQVFEVVRTEDVRGKCMQRMAPKEDEEEKDEQAGGDTIHRNVNMGVSKKSVSWTSTFVTMVLQENERRSDVTFVVQTFWTPPFHCQVIAIVFVS